MVDRVEVIEGGITSDFRGSLRYVNDFNFRGVKRFYEITQADTTTVRAWQGHKIEHKYFFVAKGSFLIGTVEIDDWTNPSHNLHSRRYILTQNSPAILSIPKGYANGIKALVEGSILIVFSNLTLKESEADRWTFDKTLWLDWDRN